MFPQLLLALALNSGVQSAVLPKRSNNTGTWSVAQFSSLITFGDSYTDENRLNYFFEHAGAAPPPGTLLPEVTFPQSTPETSADMFQSLSTPSGGRTWPRYVIQYTGAEINGAFDPHLTLYDYAVSGAVCSNELTPRFFSSLNADFPSVVDYEIPAFLADETAVRNGTSEAYFMPGLTPSDAVYTMWIGTNDVGVNAFLTDSQVPGVILSNYTDCVFSAFDSLYANGGRYFVLFNLAPLYLAPLYANDTEGGVGPGHAWPDKPDNHTAIAEQMKEYVTTLNDVYKYQLPYELLVAKRYPGVNFALFDVYSLVCHSQSATCS